MPPTASDAHFDSLLTRMLEKSLISVPYASLAADGLSGHVRSPSCAVCLEDFPRQEEVCVLPSCGHIFHAVCIRSWVRCSWRISGGLLPTCPLCRVSLDLETHEN
ncbi:hypothetical protein KP509_09G083100 [Ceratopteris richardii]|uniref:RING-type domain-containing protein n=1 Tax=Ceratopteris richardii TaxID=49495 RepID=A0A8T2U476_CERRI|nr:hypothetical protein KP509_09G083100 [Ceratopteris richardii]